VEIETLEALLSRRRSTPLVVMLLPLRRNKFDRNSKKKEILIFKDLILKDPGRNSQNFLRHNCKIFVTLRRIIHKNE